MMMQALFQHRVILSIQWHFWQAIKHYIDKLDKDQKRFLKIRPGITSPATLKYSKEEYLLSDKENPEEYHDSYILPDKVKLNLIYLENNNLLNDLLIILKTVFRKDY